MMNKTLSIFKHEFLHTIKRTGFIVITLIVPLFALLGIGIGRLASTTAKPLAIETKTMGFVDETGQFNRQISQGHVKLVRFKSSDAATQALVEGDISEYFVIGSTYMSTGTIHRFTIEKELRTPFPTSAVIKNFLTSNLLAEKVPPDVVGLVLAPVDIKVTRITKTGAATQEKSGVGNLIIPGVFGLLLGCSLMFSSNYLLQGLGEEKESRLIEVLLASVSVRQLLIGKILGLGAAGLVQVLVWLISAPMLLSLASATLRDFGGKLHIPPNFIALGILYFVLGYLLFAVLSVGIGSICPNAKEGQQLGMIYTLSAFVPVWVLSLLIFFPDSPIWIALTLFPVTAPVQAMLRLGVTGIPAWELIASIAVLVLSIMGGLWAAIRVFRAHLLMHGKRPSFAEIVHNLKNS